MSITYQPTLEWMAAQPDELLIEIWFHAGRINNEDRQYWRDLLPKLRAPHAATAVYGLKSTTMPKAPSVSVSTRDTSYLVFHRGLWYVFEREPSSNAALDSEDKEMK